MRRVLLIFLALSLMLSFSACSLLPKSSTGSESKTSTQTVTDKEMTLTFSFGERTGIYTGEAVNDLPQGNGKFSGISTQGVAWNYEGQWVNGHMQGQGTTEWVDGFTESGLYQNDFLNGEGKEVLDSVLMYEGNYKNGNYDGQGILYNSFGETVYLGVFANGYLKETSEQRQARLDPFKQQCVQSAYIDYYESAKLGTEEKVIIPGTIFQVYEKNEEEPALASFLMAADNDKNNIVQVYYRLNEGEQRPSENQKVTLWGTTGTLYSYTSDTGETLTIPVAEAWSVE